MHKRIQHIFRIAVFLSTIFIFKTSHADPFFGKQSVKETEYATESATKKKSAAKREEPSTHTTKETKVEDSPFETIPDTSSADKTENEGPPYPFIYQNKGEDRLSCKVTPFIEPAEKNQNPIRKGNNLMRKAGSSKRAIGDYVQITGIVVDENCMPIQGAVIEIWQTDLLGNYEWEYNTNSHWELPLPGKDSNFLFSGTAQTENLGQFNLLTIYPGAKGANAPFINVIVKRNGYEELHTRMYFEDNKRNAIDPTLRKLDDDGRESVIMQGRDIDPTGRYEGHVFYFPIVMRGISSYKRF